MSHKIFKMAVCLWVLVCSAQFLESSELFTYGTAPDRDPFQYAGTTETTSENNIETRTLTLYQMKPEDAKNMLALFFPETTLLASPAEKKLVARGTREDLNQIQKMISQVDKEKPQVEIYAEMVEISESGLKELGVLWKSLEQGFQIDQNQNVIQQMVQKIGFLEQTGQAKVIARPRISTIEGQEALIKIGDRIPYTIPVTQANGQVHYSLEYLDAGIQLKVFTQMGTGGQIFIKLSPVVSSIKMWKSTPGGEFPVLSTREVQTQLQMQSGQTLLIGGLLSEEERQNLSKLPVLGDLPLLGGLFQSKINETAKTDIVFLMTPKILNK
jgi:type II secretory pathway component GspD/PulD (secretin)